jgi:hypothetical protein
MKNFIRLAALVFCSTVLFNSCTVQKRIHNSGYHISYSKSLANSNNKDVISAVSSKVDVIKSNEDEELLVAEIKEVSDVFSSNAIVKVKNSKKVEETLTVLNNESSSLVKESISGEPIQLVREIIDHKVDAKRLNLDGDRNYEPTVHWGAVAGFICSILGIFFAGIILGLLGVIFSSIALSKVNEQPERYSGKGLAIAGIIIGVVVLLLTLIAINAIITAG